MCALWWCACVLHTYCKKEKTASICVVSALTVTICVEGKTVILFKYYFI
jgi:hypothetical protein